MDERAVMKARRIDLVAPRDEEEIIGEVTTSVAGDLHILGKRLRLSDATEYRNLAPGDLEGMRVKVEGLYMDDHGFAVDTVSVRGPGRERITGRIDGVLTIGDGYLLKIMDILVFVDADLVLGLERPLEQYAVVPKRTTLREEQAPSEDDQFGEGVRIGQAVRVATMVETRFKREDNYNLDEEEREDRDDLGVAARTRVMLDPSAYGITAQLEFRYNRLWRDDDEDGSLDTADSRMGESFLSFNGALGDDFDMYLGRMDFDDRREWLYDQNLDGLRLFWKIGDLVAEASATTILSDGNLLEENTDNYTLYLSDARQNYAAYVVHRKTSRPFEQNISHFGLRAFGEWPKNHDNWLEVAAIHGSRKDQDGKATLGGWAIDAGTTWRIGDHWYLTGAWAYGTGDGDTNDGSDNNFRQTGLQDNNGKFGGVTSFRYYGELVDPELANLHIATLGLGYRFNKESSLDLVGHYYRQDEPARKLIDSDLDMKANGIDRELGWEVDAILGWRPSPTWDLELVYGWFKAGKAFEDASDASVGKVHVRFRY
ncbi:MAG: alginate export family protein [Halioglobus sp.]|nr:alginate export family protein [Halioglobus sp.]